MAPISIHKPVVVVTGASKGIGLAVTRILLEKLGANVVALSRSRSPEFYELQQVHTSNLLHCECDVTNEESVKSALTDGHKRFHSIDALVLNAGVLEPLGRLDSQRVSVNDWRSLFEVNFFSLVGTLHVAIPMLRVSHHGGRVIFVSSGSATSNTSGMGAYCTSKAAVNSLCRQLAMEEPKVVAVALRPGMVDTEMQTLVREVASGHMPDHESSKFKNAHKDDKLVRPEQSGHVIAAMALRASQELSGQFVNWSDDICKPYQAKEA